MLFRTRARKATFIVVAGIALAVIISVAGPALDQRFKSGLDATQVGGRRADLWLGAASAYTRNPVLGIGYGAFKPTMFQWLIGTPGVRLNLFDPNTLRSGQPVHNDYLESMTELGPFGLFLFLGVIWTTGLSFVRTARKAKRLGDQFIRGASTALMIGLVTFATGSFFLPTETSRTLWMFVGLSLALPEVLLAKHEVKAMGGTPQAPDVGGPRLDAPMLRLATHVGPASAS
jgi:O-antigen ligase